MADPSSLENLEQGQAQNPHVQAERLMLHVKFVELDFVRYGKLISAVDLGVPRNSGNQPMNPFLGSQRGEIALVEERRSRPDQAHVALEYAVELRQLVQAEPAQDLPDGSHPVGGVFKQMRRYGRCSLTHGPELGHFENSVIFADAVGPVYGIPIGRATDQQRYAQHQIAKRVKKANPNQNIKNPLRVSV